MYKIENISTPPFAQYSAEEEIDIEAIYYEQQNYHELLELTKSGVVRCQTKVHNCKYSYLL